VHARRFFLTLLTISCSFSLSLSLSLSLFLYLFSISIFFCSFYSRSQWEVLFHLRRNKLRYEDPKRRIHESEKPRVREIEEGFSRRDLHLWTSQRSKVQSTDGDSSAVFLGDCCRLKNWQVMRNKRPKSTGLLSRLCIVEIPHDLFCHER